MGGGAKLGGGGGEETKGQLHLGPQLDLNDRNSSDEYLTWSLLFGFFNLDYYRSQPLEVINDCFLLKNSATSEVLLCEKYIQ